MTRDFAVPADLNVALDLNECADPAAVSDLAAIEIYQIGLVDHDTISKYHVVSDHALCVRLFMIRNEESTSAAKGQPSSELAASNNLLRATLPSYALLRSPMESRFCLRKAKKKGECLGRRLSSKLAYGPQSLKGGNSSCNEKVLWISTDKGISGCRGDAR